MRWDRLGMLLLGIFMGWQMFVLIPDALDSPEKQNLQNETSCKCSCRILKRAEPLKEGEG